MISCVMESRDVWRLGGRSLASHFCAFETISVTVSISLLPALIWTADVTNDTSIPGVSHYCHHDGRGQHILGMWTMSPWLTVLLITIHDWEEAYSGAYGALWAVLGLMCEVNYHWIIRPRRIWAMIINMHHSDWNTVTSQFRYPGMCRTRHFLPNKEKYKCLLMLMIYSNS